MPQPAAPSRVLPKLLPKAPARQCRTLASSAQRPAASRRPTPATSPTARQTAPRPLEQRRWKTLGTEKLKSRYRSGPFTLKAGILFLITGAGLMWYFEHERERMRRKRISDAHKGVGKARVGGPFELIDQNGKTVTQQDLMGRYSLVYFGFSHCPDICPEELDKMAAMFDIVDKGMPGKLTPVFVTCDPARDTPAVLKQYLVEFHPSFLGLTGTYEQIKAMCKAYRVYFSTPRDVKPGEDYLVDHSIYFYLMDPEGDFVEALGRQHSPDAAGKIILNHMKGWKGSWKTAQ